MTRLRRAWMAWLALPQGMRPGLVLAALIFILTMLLALWPLDARAEEAVLRTADSTLRLMDTACSHGETLAQLKPEWRAKFKNARATINGKLWFGCWIHDREGNVHVLFEDGEEGDFEVTRFKPDGT